MPFKAPRKPIQTDTYEYATPIAPTPTESPVRPSMGLLDPLEEDRYGYYMDGSTIDESDPHYPDIVAMLDHIRGM